MSEAEREQKEPMSREEARVIVHKLITLNRQFAPFNPRCAGEADALQLLLDEVDRLEHHLEKRIIRALRQVRAAEELKEGETAK